MTNVILSQDTAKATAFFDYAERHKLALGGLQPKSKDPFEDRNYHPLAFQSRLRSDWDWWCGEGMNLALPGKPNNLLLIDIDVASVGRDMAWSAYVKWLATIDVAFPEKPGDQFYPQSASPSGGWHVYVQLPETLPHTLRDYRIPVRTADVRPLTDAEKADKRGNKECVGVRFGMYLVAPGSYYDGRKPGSTAGYYTLQHDAPPYDCPPKLLELMRKDEVTAAPSPDTMRNVEELLPLLPRHVLEKLNEDVPKGERSDAIPRAVIPLIAGGFSDDEIFNLIWTHPLGAKGWDQGETWLRNDIKRQRAKGFGASPSVAQMFGNVASIVSPPIAPTMLSPPPGEKPKKLIQSSSEFVASFVAPAYLLDGILQKRFCYSLTAATGAGKTAIALRLASHVALGRRLGDREVEQGRVLYFAAENYVDVQARWIAMAEHCGFDVNAIDVHFVPGASKLSEIAERITKEAQELGDLALVIVDTSAATFEGDDENGNVDAGTHARRMRSLTELQGRPTALVLCHPVKNATNENLVPRGGGAFIAEIDGNLCARKSDSAVEVHWTGKFRGMDFAPMVFRLDTVAAERLKDARGRTIPTVMATPIDDAAKQMLAATERSDQDQVLKALEKLPGESLNKIAEHLGWRMRDGKPYGVRVGRALKKLANDGLVQKHRDEWVLSKDGQKELNKMDWKSAADGTHHVSLPPLFPLPMGPKP
jgi:hypothetical protein